MKTIATNLKLLIISCTLIFLFSSCGKTNYHQLTPEDLAWIVYKEGDVVKFKNDTGGVMAFSMFHKTRSYKTSGKNYFEETGISIKYVIGIYTYSGLLYFKLTETGNIITLSWPLFNGALTLSSSVPITKTIGNSIYTDIYVGNSPDASGVYTIKTFYYSKTAGMVQFITRDSLTWNKTN